MNAIIYTKNNCEFCIKAKEFMRNNGIQFSESVIGQDIVREEFVEQYPNQATVPLIFIEGERIGGYSELVSWHANRPQLLNE